MATKRNKAKPKKTAPKGRTAASKSAKEEATASTNSTTRRRAAARFHDWRPRFLESLATHGIVGIAAQDAGIDRTTPYVTREKQPKFAEAWDAAIELSIDSLENEAIRRARDGTDEPVFWNGEEVGKIRKYSDPLLKFLLTCKRAKVFRDRQEIDHGVVDENGKRVSLSFLQGLAARHGGAE